MNDPLKGGLVEQHVVIFVASIRVLVCFPSAPMKYLGWADYKREREERVVNSHIKRVKVMVLASAGSDVEATAAGRSTKERARPHHPTGSQGTQGPVISSEGMLPAPWHPS